MVRLFAVLTVLAFSFAYGHTAERLSAPALAGKIDEHVAARWKERGVTPAPVADDAVFVRRLHLDLHGRIPDILAARDFADDPDKDKRARLVARLLGEERYAVHWASVWSGWLLPENIEPRAMAETYGFERWLRDKLHKNASYGHIVRGLLVADQLPISTPARAFLAAREFKAEDVAAAASRLFLGIKLECAQCHNHPFAQWRKQQFWEFAAFFERPTAAGDNAPKVRPAAEPRFPDGKRPNPLGARPGSIDLRDELANWMTRADNPYFARAAVNRVWEYLLGTGLVEPLDEESADNPPSHPALLDLLAQQFIAHEFDLKYLLQAITLSATYQRSSAEAHPSQADPRLFARARLRGLSPQQLFDSLIVAAGREDEPEPEANFPMNDYSRRGDFLRRFPAPSKRSEQETSILQALYLMNGKVMHEAVGVKHNLNLGVLALGKTASTAKALEQLFLIALSRKPTARESARLVKYLDKGGPTGDRGRALEDVFWALLNSSEFCLNH